MHNIHCNINVFLTECGRQNSLSKKKKKKEEGKTSYILKKQSCHLEKVISTDILLE
jgi:hypothetical protein